MFRVFNIVWGTIIGLFTGEEMPEASTAAILE